MKARPDPSRGSSKRTYDSSRRQADARERRRRVVEAAHDLFLEEGYGATSIEQIAAAAEVSPQMVYANFSSKAGILARVADFGVVGDDEDVALSDRPEVKEVIAIEDPRERIRAFAALTCRIHLRVARVVRLIEGVAGADPAVAELFAETVRQRRAQSRFTAEVLTEGGLSGGMGLDELTGTMYLLTGPVAWNNLVVDCGWTPEMFEQWLDGVLARLLLP